MYRVRGHLSTGTTQYYLCPLKLMLAFFIFFQRAVHVISLFDYLDIYSTKGSLNVQNENSKHLGASPSPPPLPLDTWIVIFEDYYFLHQKLSWLYGSSLEPRHLFIPTLYNINIRVSHSAKNGSTASSHLYTMQNHHYMNM